MTDPVSRSVSPELVVSGLPKLLAHLRDPLHRTGYLLILGTGIGSLLGFLFWGLAAHGYSAYVVGISSTLISAMMLVSGICQLGLRAVLVRYLPTAGGSAGALVLRTYALTVAISLVLGTVAAATSELWSPPLGFIAHDRAWFAGFVVSTALWTVFTLEDSVLTGMNAVPWVPITNSMYAVVKLLMLVMLIGLMPVAGPFVAWNVPVALFVVFVTVLIFRRLVPEHRRKDASGTVDRGRFAALAAGNYGGTLFALAATMLLPVLVANTTSPREAAYFYVPWTISIGLQLIALNMTISLTVEAALDESRLRQLTRRALAVTMWIVVPVAVVSAVAAPLILGAFGAAYAAEGDTLLVLLALAAVPNVLQTLGLAVARVQHRGRLVLAIQASQCVLALGLSAVLLPRHGIEGVGIAWLVSQVVVSAGVVAGPLRPLLLTRAS